jgi:ABC-type nitrate/sulfonate/bicarbonate transport system substrate-binding protein
MKVRPWLLGVGVAVLIGGIAYVLFGLNTDTKTSPEVHTIRIGVRPRVLSDPTPAIVAKLAAGDQSIRIELVPEATFGGMLQKLDAGSIEVVTSAPAHELLLPVSAGETAKFRIYAGLIDTPGASLLSIVGRKESQIARIEDLRGKTVATLPAEQARWSLREILKANGITPTDVKIVNMNPATALTQLNSGDFDALFATEPIVSAAVASGANVISNGPISQYMFAGEPVPSGVSALRAEWAEANPEAVEKYLDYVDQAIALLRNDPARARQMLLQTEYLGLNPQVVDSMKLADVRRPSDDTNRAGQDLLDKMTAAGLLKSNLKYVDLLYNE